MLGDLLDLVHTLTRLKAVPSLRDGPDLPEAERTRGAALAERLSMPALGRAWQMLLKGAQEVEQATDRRAALLAFAGNLADDDVTALMDAFGGAKPKA